MSEDEIKDADMNLVRTHVEALGEHFDSVQILQAAVAYMEKEFL